MRLFCVLATAFLVVGASVAFLFLSDSFQDDLAKHKNELRTLAQVMALQVDPAAHETLTAVEQQDSPPYREQVAKLERALKLTQGVRYVYTIRKSGDRFYFVLDPTPPGDHDADGVDDKSYLMEPYEDVPVALLRAFRTGIVQVDDEPTTDRWGTFISAYAPIRDSTGNVVAVLGIDRTYDLIANNHAGPSDQALGALFLIAGISLLLAWVIASRWAPRVSPSTTRRVGTSRALLLEVVLYCFVFALTITGIVGQLSNQRELQANIEISATEQRLSKLRQVCSQFLKGQVGSEVLLQRLRSEVSSMGNSSLSGALIEAEDLLRDAKTVPKGIATIGSAIEDAESDALVARRQNLEILERRGTMLVALFTISTLVSLVSLILIRHSARQQSDLNELLLQNNRQEVLSSQLMTNLPIGLIAYAAEGCLYANPAWDALLGRGPEEDHLQVLARRLHPADRERVLDTLEAGLKRRNPITMQFRLVSEGQSAQFIELRGVPVYGPDGEFEHVLAFGLDTTRTVHARKQLHEKNREIVANNRRLTQALDDLEENLEAMVRALVKAVEAKDPYTAGHSERVMGYSLKMAHRMELTEGEIRALQMGTLIHDIGKIGIPDDVLTSTTSLSPDEMTLVRTHAELGYRMIEGIPMFSDCACVVRWHHERLDGSGYPDGLIGDEIPLIVRIAAVADSFDAMTSTRAYRAGMTVENALRELRFEAAQGRLDLHTVEVLARLIEDEGLLSQDVVTAA